MTKSKLIDYLFNQIKERGVDTTFGIPGDFVLPVYAAQEKAGLKTVVMTHEPSVGFAADAYARLRGLGVALVTYGAGGLNMINPVGLAYAEESPVVVISGAPETKYQLQKPQLHHCVKSFNTQLHVFSEVTTAQAVLNNPVTAQSEIDRVLETTVQQSRPTYFEVPRDMVNFEIEINNNDATHEEDVSKDKAEALEEAVVEVIERLKSARSPVVLAGVEVRRFGLKDKLVALVEAFNLPVVTSILGKATFPESHPNFIGNYFGQFGNPRVREFVENSDCILSLGTVLTEMETAGYTAKLPTGSLIQATAREISVGYHTYSNVTLKSVVEELLSRATSKLDATMRFTVPTIEPEELKPGAKALTVAAMIEDLNEMLN
ncbi:MAG: hypothetical protein K2Z81_06145, partial [Cyanobacteria bacterium]|nr:hypothetical protein [Cyanobacteriota bacterium]